ncbi:MAG TPA: CBS domain-containing protein [Candidatus Binatia bacterium]|nr:CBS domain-containing protein [Candidatus Binatia bacterium]
MKLQDIMVEEVIQISPEESVGEAARRMREKSVGCLIATVDGTVKGLITDRDLLGCLDERHDPYQCKVLSHMSQPVTVLPPEDDIATAVDVMHTRRIKRLPIARHEKLLGIVSLSDLAAVAHDQVEKLWPSWMLITTLIAADDAHARGWKVSSKSSATKR